MHILGIETSCDETAAAVINGNRGRVTVLSNIISSQIDIHKKYGGVVPEVAAREHVTQILPVVNEALETAGIKRDSIGRRYSLPSRMTKGRGGINAIAVTVGPGLITSLITGIETAKVLSYVWDIPLIAVNHIEGHIYANFIGVNSNNQAPNSKQYPISNIQYPKIKFPALIMTVSGGHTILALMKGHGKYKTIGETRDDAAGEAFDKAAQILGLSYPGGPIISEYASKFIKKNPQITNLSRTKMRDYKLQITNKSQIPNNKISLPRPMLNSNDFDFSFSGLKTAILYEVQKDKNYKKHIPEYCCEFQQAVIDVLIHKTIKAAKKYKVKNIMLAGGVAANKELRLQMEKAVKDLGNVNFYMPELKYTTDNAPMVATAGYFHSIRKDFTPWNKIKVDCNFELK
ncbi:MAG: tRNA (adenosine(37)-N6)-threonylcarbamoyltransferase complex transferase subunit TsaD [Patescibacteria group bacterium]